LITCPGCGQRNAAASRFCTYCGTKIPDAAEAVADRRIITVLFTDVSGFTAMSEQLDPEAVSNIINDFFAVLVKPIYRYGGVVDKYIGDAIMALFGAPVAHEDDPERAVRAAWEMQVSAQEFSTKLERQTGIGLKVRIGLNTGLVVAGAVGGSQRSDYTVIGDTVNLAQRMEANARPGKILVTSETFLQTRHAFRFDSLAPITVKGKSEPVEVYEVVGPRPRAIRAVEDDIRVVGRDAELERLDDAWRRAKAGKPQAVLLSGDVGQGKSALSRRFLSTIRPDAQIHGTRCLSFEQQTAYALTGSLLLGCLGLPEFAPSAQISAHLRQFLSGIFPDDAGLADRLGHLLGLQPELPDIRSLSPRQLRTSAFLALNDLIVRLAAQGPLVLSLEDLHWADDASLEWIRSLLDRLSGADADQPVMVLIQARPESDLNAPELDSRIAFMTIALRPLDKASSLDLGAMLLGATLEALSPQVRAVLERACDKAEGNPYFLAEMLRGLREAGVLVQERALWVVAKSAEEAAMPASIRSAIAAHLDRLPAAMRKLVQVAAVIGRRFDAALLARVLGDDPTSTVADLVHQKILVQRTGGGLSFVQGVIQEVAYGHLLLSRRRELHRQVGIALEETLGDDVTLHASTLAHHFEQVDDAVRAARYRFWAGRRARAAFSNAEAVLNFEKAVTWLDRASKAPDTAAAGILPPRSELLLDLALTQTQLGNLDEAMAHLDAVASFAPPAARVVRARGDVLERQGKIEEALAEYDRAAKLAEDPLEAARAAAAIGNVRRRLGQYREAIAISQEAQAQLLALSQPAEAAVAHGVLGICYHRMGDSEEASRHHAAALRLREQAGDVDGLARSHNNLGIIGSSLGRFAEAQSHYARSLTLFQRLGDKLSTAMVLNNLGDLHLKLGDDALAERHFREALRLSQKYGNAVESLTALGNLAEVFLARQAGAEALACIDSSLALMEQTRHGEFAAELRCMRGRALATMGRHAEACNELQIARDLAGEVGNAAFQAVVDHHLAEVLKVQ
jgi:class 3 adenylate cyclase/predicted ATPase